MDTLISHSFSIEGNPTVLNTAKKDMLHKSKYKQRYFSQNNTVLKFRNASNETTSSAIYEIIKNGVAEDSKFLGRYAVSVGTFRWIKKCNTSGLVVLQEHVAEGTKQPQ